MKIKAAVAFEAAKPLEIDEIELAGPKAGECWCGSPRPASATPTPTRSRGAIPRACSRRARTRGRGRRRGGRPGRHVGGAGRSRDPALHARVSAVQVLSLGQDQPLHHAPRQAGQGPDARRHEPALAQGPDDPPLHGHVDVRERTVLPEIALAKIRHDAPLDKVCLLGCGVTTGIGAVLYTAKVEPGVERGGVRARRRRALGDPGRGDGGRRAHHRDRHEPGEVRAREAVRRHRPLNPADAGNLVEAIVELTGGGVDYSFECIGNVEVMGQALQVPHRGWGQSIIIGVAGAGQEIHARPFLLVTGRSWRGRRSAA